MVLAHNFNGVNRTKDVKISQDVTFETMLLNDNTLQGLKDSGFYKPSPIQLHGIPLGKCGFDLLLEAKSGTGKTAVFTVIALEKINLNNGLQVIILAPTREIAAQICDVIIQIGAQYSGLSVEVVMGGLPVKDDIEKLQKQVHIIVGSPGRLHHLIKDKNIDTSTVRLLVFDEADKLMEKSFKSDIDYIFCSLPQQKQIILSSATFSEESKEFISQYVQLPQHICPDSNSVLLGITQTVTVVSHNTNVVRQTQHKFEELLNILSKREFKQCLIFCNYQARVTDLHKMLKKAKWPAEKLHGQQEQTDRLDALKTLQEYKCRILIATDLAARGLDSSHIDLVVNFEIPRDWQTYLHRIGRAGRFGTYGLAVNILSTKEEKQFKELMNSLQFQLDIKNFWSNEQFEYTDLKTPDSDTLEKTISSSSSDKEVAEKDVYQDLWDALTCDTVQNYEVETFDDFCQSFEGANDKVETFENLLESFENCTVKGNNNDHSAVNSNYIILEPIEKKIEKLIQHVQYLHCNSNKASNLKKYSKSSSEEKVVPVMSDESEAESLSKQDKPSLNNRVNKHKDHNKPTKVDKVEAEPQDTDNKTNGKAPTQDNPNLHNLDFHTVKKDKPSRKTKENIKKPSNNYNATKPSKCYNEYQENDTSDNGYNTASYDFKRTQQGFTVGLGNNYYYLNTQEAYTRNYINWYNYLKFRTKQIEMAVYIDEMSKL